MVPWSPVGFWINFQWGHRMQDPSGGHCSSCTYITESKRNKHSQIGPRPGGSDRTLIALAARSTAVLWLSSSGESSCEVPALCLFGSRIKFHWLERSEISVLYYTWYHSHRWDRAYQRLTPPATPAQTQTPTPVACGFRQRRRKTVEMFITPWDEKHSTVRCGSCHLYCS